MRPVLVFTVFLMALAPRAQASGACCAVTQVGAPDPTLGLVFSFADGHEMIGGEEYTLEQLAAVVKVSWPLSRQFTVQGQIGVPFSDLAPHGGMDGMEPAEHGPAMDGEGGFLYGLGLGYRFPEQWDRLDLFASLSGGQSFGRITDRGGEPVDRTFVITEIQGVFLAEFALAEKASLYAGARLYTGRNLLRGGGEPKEKGDREGNMGGVFGLRFRPAESVTVVAEYGNGHTRLFSIGTVITLSR